MTNSEARDHAFPAQGSGLAVLRGDCARMAPHWVAAGPAAPCPVPPSRIHGVVVPPGSARLLDAMAGYGD